MLAIAEREKEKKNSSLPTTMECFCAKRQMTAKKITTNYTFASCVNILANSVFLTRRLICLYVCEEVRLGCNCVLAARKQNPISKKCLPPRIWDCVVISCYCICEMTLLRRPVFTGSAQLSGQTDRQTQSRQEECYLWSCLLKIM